MTPAVAASFERAGALSSYTPAMKITRIDTTYWRSGSDLPWKPNWVWVRVYTDSGLEGLGETYPRKEVEASGVLSQPTTAPIHSDIPAECACQPKERSKHAM
jgi:L-alanine-DL-glutamate epimerase-like enolase superfamily enzyme